MKEIREVLHQHKKNLRQELQRMNKMLEKAPKATLQICRKKQEVYFYSNYVDGEGKSDRHYIRKGDEKTLTPLALKTYCLRRKKEIEQELESIELYEIHMEPRRGHKASELLYDMPVLSELLQQTLRPMSRQAEEWAKEGNPSTYREEEKRHSSKGGLKVRSKAEAMIASCLEEREIPFRYEDRIRLQGGSAIPDFTIMHPTTGKKIYWEHLGMMDDMAYYESAIEKLAMYQANGILLGNNLILTIETLQQPLTYRTIQGMVESIIEA